MSEKLNQDTFQLELDELKKLFNKKTDKMVDDLYQKLEQNKMSLMGRQGDIDRKMKEIEKKNIWRMNEVEVLLDSRASKQYVDDNLKDLENKLNTLVIWA